MTHDEFHALCLWHNLSTNLALENDDVRFALAERDDDEVRRLLLEEF